MAYADESAPNYPYVTVAESIHANGVRHMNRAMMHYAEGKPEYAKGSLRKARRNFERAALLRGMLIWPRDA